jgi:hypothetical protein
VFMCSCSIYYDFSSCTILKIELQIQCNFKLGYLLPATQDYITSLEQLAKPKVLDLFQRRYLRSLTVGNYNFTFDINSFSLGMCVENDFNSLYWANLMWFPFKFLIYSWSDWSRSYGLPATWWNQWSLLLY